MYAAQLMIIEILMIILIFFPLLDTTAPQYAVRLVLWLHKSVFFPFLSCYVFFFRLKFCFLFISIENSPCRGSKVSRDPGSSVGDVHHDCCFYSCYDCWFVVAFPSREVGGFYFPSLYGWALSVLKISAHLSKHLSK